MQGAQIDTHADGGAIAAIGRGLGAMARRTLMLLARALVMAIRVTARALRRVVVFGFRWMLAFAVLTGLAYAISILLVGRVPTSQFWQGMILMLLMIGALIMSRGQRVSYAGSRSTQSALGNGAN